MLKIFQFVLYSAFVAAAFCSIQHFNLSSIQKLTVMASEAKPFVFKDKQSVKGVEIELIKNFAKKFKLDVEYIVTNESLREVFSNEIQSELFLRSIKHLYVII